MLATVVAVGSLAAISLAMFGPETTATLSGGTSEASTTTSLIRFMVPRSRPFISDTTTASPGSR